MSLKYFKKWEFLSFAIVGYLNYRKDVKVNLVIWPVILLILKRLSENTTRKCKFIALTKT